MESVIFKRDMLYDEVWSKPMTELAKEYGINVYQLTKACIELEIPRPESGYWPKLQHGKTVKKKPLPESEKKEYHLTLDVIRPTKMNELLPKGYKPIVVNDQLRNPHPLVRKTYKYLKEHGKGKFAGDYYGRLKPFDSGYLNVSVSKGSLKRTMRILDAIFKESERQGFEVEAETKNGRNHTYIKVEDYKADIFIQEEAKQIKTKSKDPKYSWREYDYERYTTGNLKLYISSQSFGCSNRTIIDKKTQTIEEQLDNFFPFLLEIIQKGRERQFEWEEAERKEEIARKIREQEEREYQAEMISRSELEQLSESFTKSRYIYQFIKDVEAEIEGNKLSQEQLKRLSEWKNWATEHVDRLNPVKQQIEAILGDEK